MTDRWGTQPAGFNRQAAEVVYKALTAMDEPEAQLFGTILVDATVQRDLARWGTELAKAADAVATQRATQMRKSLRREIVQKAARGEDTSRQLRALEALLRAEPTVLAKADEARDERGRWATHDTLRHGLTARDHVRIGYDSSYKTLKAKHAAQLGIPYANGLVGEHQARYQQAFPQLHQLTSSFHGMGDNGLVHLHIVNSKTNVEHTALAHIPAKGGHVPLASLLRPNEYLHSASVSTQMPVTASGAVYDALAGLGAPGAGAVAYNVMESGPAFRHFADQQQRRLPQDDYIPSQRVFRNLESGSRLLNDSLGDAAPRGAKYALLVGEHVGKFGPEAQKVIGPTADRTAYRYRGTERPVTRPLGNALESIRRDPTLGSGADRREFLLHGKVDDQQNWEPSGVLDYFRRQLPSVDLNTLQLKSGTVPPSRGVIINSKGQVEAESVGYGDDHYLPFNLRGLARRGLKGGEYIRTRTYGGPTTEDLYTGLMTGARGMTVVSHNGVYTIDFNKDLRGGRRHNDKAARMVGRYGHLLDAVRSNQVALGGIHPSRMEEINAQAGQLYDEDRNPEGFKKEVARLVAREQKNPTLSADQKREAELAFFQDQASMIDRADGQVLNPDHMVNALIEADANASFARDAKAAKEGGYTGFNLDAHRAASRKALEGLPVDEVAPRLAEALGKKRAYDKAMAGAEAANKRALSPLRLNGEGYKIALDALQEQFPYEIDRVEFHPWEGQRRTAPAGKEDTGYVRPNHNRAAEALSGYFDHLSSRSAPGQPRGKVYADSTRWQNGQQRVREFGAKVEDKADEAKAKVGAPSAASAAEMKADANKAFFQAIKGTQNLGAAPTNAVLARGPRASMTTVLGDETARTALEQAAPNVFKLLNMDDTQYDRMADEEPQKLEAVLVGARREVATTKVLDLEARDLANFDSGGRPPARRKLDPENPSASLPNMHLEHEFPGASDAYDPTSAPSPERIQAAYAADVAPLIASGDLPARIENVTSDRLNEVKAKLEKERSALKSRDRAGYPRDDRAWERTNRASESLIRAAQLHRRHGEVAVATTAPAAAPAADLGGNTDNHLHLPPVGDTDPDAWADATAKLIAQMNQTLPIPDNGRSINQ